MTADSRPILATAVVPWTERFEFDEEMFCREVETIACELTRHIYVFGTAGEGYAVNEKQFDQIATAFWRSAQQHGVSAMLGVISLSLPTIIDRIGRGHAMGFREFQLSLPSWGALNDRELEIFFAETCGRFPDCRFLHYNLIRSKRLLTATDYRRLAVAHPNLVAVKFGSKDPAVVADMLTMSPRIQFFFTEFAYTIARRTHDVGLLISLASVDYARAKEFVNGDGPTRDVAVTDFLTMGEALREISSGKFHIDGGYDKMLFRLNHAAFPLRLLPPYQGPSEEDFERFRAALPMRWRRQGFGPPQPVPTANDRTAE